MKTTLISLMIGAVIFSCPTIVRSQSAEAAVARRANVPSQGFVPDAATAAAIAEAILVPIYGQGSIDGQKPFLVSLDNDVWTIWGHRKIVLPGGVFRLQISKEDASVKSLTHGK